MILTHLQKNIRVIFLALSGLFGLALGTFCAALLGVFLQAETTAPAAEKALASRPVRQAALQDYRDILKRDVFNSAGGNLSFAPDRARTPDKGTPRVMASDWELIGTISGGPTPLATMRAQGETKAYRQGADLPGGGKLKRVERSRVTIVLNGREQVLTLPEKGAAIPARASAKSVSRQKRSAKRKAPGIGVRSLGANRWQITRSEAEKARGNIGELLKQARLEPNLVNGQTAGFMVKMIQPGTLLSQLGLKVGDVLHEINGVPLDSPEKALQIFQQLRQARQVNIALERSGSPLTFSYEID